MTTNKDLLRQRLELRDDFISDRVVIEEFVTTDSRPSLGGQNHIQFFLVQANAFDASGWAERATHYDQDIQNAFLTALDAYIDGFTTRDEAIQAFKDTVVIMYPEINIK